MVGKLDGSTLRASGPASWTTAEPFELRVWIVQKVDGKTSAAFGDGTPQLEPDPGDPTKNIWSLQLEGLGPAFSPGQPADAQVIARLNTDVLAWINETRVT
jgi:hypothetical protein